MNTPRTVNTRPQLIARFAAGEAVGDNVGAILVYLFETATDPVFRLVVNCGELPEGMREEYGTAREAIQTAADLSLTLIYDTVHAITESGDPEEDAALSARFA